MHNTPSFPYFKINNPNENNYQDGIFIIDLIPNYYYYGTNLCEIHLPSDSELQITKKENKYYVNKATLTKKYSLFHPETYKKFNLDIRKNHYLIDFASAQGRIDVLMWWVESGIELIYTYDAIDSASANNHVKILDWWMNSNLKLLYTKNAMNYASLDVLNWWKFSKLPLKYSRKAMDYASKIGNIEILNWWKQSGLKLKYSERSMYYASKYGRIDVLDWWKNSNLEIICSERCKSCALKNCMVDVLEWWKKYEIILKNMKDDIYKIDFYSSSVDIVTTSELLGSEENDDESDSEIYHIKR